MEMHQVRYFLAVADELNFTRAAERCHVAQPSLTRAIKLLEEELGGPLFHRERANTHLSELGRMVKPYLDHVYDQMQEAKRQALEFTKLKKTTLKLGVMCTIPPNQLVDLVCGLQARNPGIELELKDAGAAELEQSCSGATLRWRFIAGRVEEPDERLHSHAALPRADDDRPSSGSSARQAQRGHAEGPERRALPQPGELRVQRLRRPDLARARLPGLRAGLPQRPRRLDSGHDRERARVRLHAGELRQSFGGGDGL